MEKAKLLSRLVSEQFHVALFLPSISIPQAPCQLKRPFSPKNSYKGGIKDLGTEDPIQYSLQSIADM